MLEKEGESWKAKFPSLRAAIKYAEDVDNYRQAMGAPRQPAAIDLNRVAGATAAGPDHVAFVLRAKRRYLAHFRTSCAAGNKFASQTTAQMQALIGQISRGDLSAVVRLKRYLQILSHAFATGLSRMRSLGPPPAPDASYGRAYITAAGRMVAAIQHLGRAVGKLDAPGIATANGELKAASTAANTAARRYGFQTCGSAPASPATGLIA